MIIILKVEIEFLEVSIERFAYKQSLKMEAHASEATLKALKVKVLPSYAANAYAGLQIPQQAVTATHSQDQSITKDYVLSHT